MPPSSSATSSHARGPGASALPAAVLDSLNACYRLMNEPEVSYFLAQRPTLAPALINAAERIAQHFAADRLHLQYAADPEIDHELVRLFVVTELDSVTLVDLLFELDYEGLLGREHLPFVVVLTRRAAEIEADAA